MWARHVVVAYDTWAYPTPQDLYDAVRSACPTACAAVDASARWRCEILLRGMRGCGAELERRVAGVCVLCSRALPPGARVAAVERLIRLRVCSGGGENVDTRLLDAFKRLSGGEMHTYDLRDWRMRRGALKRMQKRVQLEDALIETLHGQYSYLLFKNMDGAADALAPALQRKTALAGGMHDVLDRQRVMRTCDE